MDGHEKAAAEVTFPDGHTETWTSSPDLAQPLSGEALRAFAQTCLKPTPVLVEVVPIPRSR